MTTIREWLSHLRNKTKQSVEKTKAETQKTYNKILDTEIDDIKSKSKSTLKNIDEKLVDASETFKSDVSKTSKIIGKFFYKFLKYSLILIIFIGFLFTCEITEILEYSFFYILLCYLMLIFPFSVSKNHSVLLFN